ncbi:putative oxidoreductase [Pseudorhodobacter antarcticus]|jgi:putative oxidoreductase|uniref:Putative oxidoreductase n=1 Tax=Pseudorhodobacter antarcticus TaxID=1077947 RepID=A0A1H8IAM3_9RHOB|nr:DoxX family membrane protein [Pseudorhodobacter antarcticus]SEN65292.1 putative oxidoreductase [Pseudorhodobacter antarcticus]
MDRVMGLYSGAVRGIEASAAGLLPLAARGVFAAVLLFYFWTSALTKLGPGVAGVFLPSDGAYIQIFPKTTEAFGYDFSQFGVFHWAVVAAGTWAEFILPLLIVVGLFTRLAACGMIGFVIVQSVVDVMGHGVGGDTLGAAFDSASGALIWDQRLLWVFLLLVLVVKGGGALALDRGLAHVWGARSQRA